MRYTYDNMIAGAPRIESDPFRRIDDARLAAKLARIAVLENERIAAETECGGSFFRRILAGMIGR